MFPKLFHFNCRNGNFPSACISGRDWKSWIRVEKVIFRWSFPLFPRKELFVAVNLCRIIPICLYARKLFHCVSLNNICLQDLSGSFGWQSIYFTQVGVSVKSFEKRFEAKIRFSLSYSKLLDPCQRTHWTKAFFTPPKQNIKLFSPDRYQLMKFLLKNNFTACHFISSRKVKESFSITWSIFELLLTININRNLSTIPHCEFCLF